MTILNPSIAPLRTQVGLILAKIEDEYNVDALPVVGDDAFLVEKIDYKVNPQVLKRDPQRLALGNYRLKIGRKIAELTFQHEVKAGGVVGGNSKLATLLRGCGFALTVVPDTAAATIGVPFFLCAAYNSAAAIGTTWAKGASAPTTGFGRYKITVILGGASATATMRVTGNPMDVDDTILNDETFETAVYGENPTTTLVESSTPDAPVYTVGGTPQGGDIIVAVVGGIPFRYELTGGDTADTAATALAAVIAADARCAGTSATGAAITVTFTGACVPTAMTSGTTALQLGASAATETPTWSGDLVAGDSWLVDTLRPGVHATPVSQAQESLTFYIFRDGNFHKITGAMGSCKITGKAGEYLQAQFTFQGQYIGAYEASFPTAGVVFECTDPMQWDLAQATLGAYSELPIDNMTLDLMNTLTMRPNASHSDGYNGFVITKRDFKCDIDPEAIGESYWREWEHFAQSDIMSFEFSVGEGVAGNTVYVMSNTAQVASAPNYQDKSGLLYYNQTLSFSQEQDNGDDEIRIVFA